MIADKLFFVAISLLVFLAKKPRHRCEHIIMIVIMIQVILLLGLRALVHDGIE